MLRGRRSAARKAQHKRNSKAITIILVPTQRRRGQVPVLLPSILTEDGFAITTEDGIAITKEG